MSSRRPPGSLVPDLWGLGVRATSEPLVALSTSGMVPLEGWLDATLDVLERSQAAAVGGPIEPEEELSSLDRAVFFLRYLNYVRPIPEPGTIEPPGDNALYRRDALPPIDGFWESRVHGILRERGESVVFEPEAIVTFHGSSRRRRQHSHVAKGSVITNEWSLLNQRFLHAWNYGSDRSRRLGWRWALARTLLAPLVPLALLSRIGRNLASKNIRPRHWLPALPFLLPLLAAWCWGEVVGYWLKPPRPRLLLSRSRRIGVFNRPAGADDGRFPPVLRLKSRSDRDGSDRSLDHRLPRRGSGLSRLATRRGRLRLGADTARRGSRRRSHRREAIGRSVQGRLRGRPGPGTRNS